MVLMELQNKSFFLVEKFQFNSMFCWYFCDKENVYVRFEKQK